MHVPEVLEIRPRVRIRVISVHGGDTRVTRLSNDGAGRPFQGSGQVSAHQYVLNDVAHRRRPKIKIDNIKHGSGGPHGRGGQGCVFRPLHVHGGPVACGLLRVANFKSDINLLAGGWGTRRFSCVITDLSITFSVFFNTPDSDFRPLSARQ